MKRNAVNQKIDSHDTGESVYIGQLKISTEVFNYKCRVAVIADVNSSEFLQFGEHI